MLYHVTTYRNLESIRRHGILTGRSQGKSKRVWLVRLERLSWAVEHVKERHGLSQAEVVCIIVYESGQPIRRASQEGVYWTPDDVIPARLGDCFRLLHQHVEERGRSMGTDDRDD